MGKNHNPKKKRFNPNGENRFLRWPGRLRHGRRMEDFELMSTKPLPKKWFPETYFHNLDDSPVVRNETF